VASVEENRRYWEEVYDWSQAGEEWSRGWGDSQTLWTASLEPRLGRFLPAQTILEIAPGYGRFTPFLAGHCQNYLGVDLSPSCVEYCQSLFPQHRFFVNDGSTLPMVETGSVDFVFSFFSLIHAEKETIQSYLREFARVLKPTGGGFVHHSNLAEHGAYFATIEKLPKRLQRGLFQAGLVDLPQWRAPSVSVEVFAQAARQAGLDLLCQETVNFGSRRTIDAFSSFVRADGPWRAPNHLWRHSSFMHEAMRARRGGSGLLGSRCYEPLELKGQLTN
jgi:ubiquinone/menaquinone biosynthesis C-methylase UbiE